MDYEQELKDLSKEFAAELPGKLSKIKSDWTLLKQKNDNERLIELIRKVHSLIGSGETFGYPELSIAAAQLEKLFRQLQEQTLSVTFTPDNFEQLIQSLEYAAQQLPHYDFSADKALPLKTAHIIQQQTPCVLLINDNEEFSTDLNKKLKTYDIQVQVLSSSTDLISSIKTFNPYCILIEISQIQHRTKELDAIKVFSQGLSQPPTLIIVSEQDNISARLLAVRANALAFFLYPVNMTELVKLIRDQCYPVIEPPYRILLIDDDAQFAHHTALLLQRAGMETQVVTEPMTVLDVLASFQPELILLDLHMPKCNGLELAAIIRQQCLYSGIVIVFFSVEADIDRHIDAFRAGGNDFFVKGLPPKQLIAKVETTATQVRVIQKLMLKDPLTGLANRAYFSEIINKQLAVSQRYQRSFSYVMLDLDHFKQVNDQFGHQAGDEVLRSLASLIIQRLRSVDTAIRYGGEEIVILLPETNAEQAKVIINELLQKSRDIIFMANKQPFSVTFSAGIAEYPSYTDPASLAEAADKALYKAKTEGRNQVCLAEL